MKVDSGDIILKQSKKNKLHEVIDGDAFWLVTYKGKAFKYRTTIEGSVTRYENLFYTEQTRCIRRVEQLNNIYGTNDFNYIELK